MDQNEAAMRLWINAFFFRVAFMLSGSSKFVLNIEQIVLPVPMEPNSVLSSFVNFTAILTTETHSRTHIFVCTSFFFTQFCGRLPLEESKAQQIGSPGFLCY